MLKVREIVNLLEREVPPELQEDWDNTGLLIGFKEREVSKILTCLEIDKRVVQEAEEIDADMIISHHL